MRAYLDIIGIIPITSAKLTLEFANGQPNGLEWIFFFDASPN